MKKLLVLLSFILGTAYAQTHTFKFILSSGPGSGSDVTLDVYSPCLKEHKVNVVKDFKPGAEGLVAIKTLQQSQDSDHNTHILLGNFGLNVLGKYPGVDLLTDINPITYINSTPLVIVGKSKKFKSLDEVISLSKQKSINVGSPSSSGSFLINNLFKELNINYQIIPYKNSVSGLTDIVNESLDLFVDTYIGARPLIEAEKIEIITSTFDTTTAKKFSHDPIEKYSKRLGKMPLGLILSVQPSTDKKVKDLIIKSFQTCGQDKEVIKKLEANNSRPLFMPTEEIVQMIKTVNGK